MLRASASRRRLLQRYDAAPVVAWGPPIASAIVLSTVAVAVRSLSGEQRGDLVWIAATLLTALVALVTGHEMWRQASRMASSAGDGWRVLAIGCWLWSIGWVIQLGTDKTTPDGIVAAILANLGYFAMLPVFFGGAVLLRPPRRLHFDGVKLLLDLIIAIATMLTVGWHWIVRPAVESTGMTWAVTAAVVVHAAGAGVLLMTLLIGLFRAGDRSLARELGLLAGSLTIVLAADLWWVTAWARLGHDAAVATAPAWILGFVAIGVAARVGRRRSFAATPPEPETNDGREPAWRVVMLYPMVLLILVLIARQAIAGERGSGVAVGVTASLMVVALVIARQGLTLRESQRITSRLTEQVDCDPLTGLINHRKVHERLDRELAHARAHGLPVAVALIDVDNFKDVNDRFGHQAGDRVLRILATVLKRTCRGTDIAARYAGDEFMLVLPGLNLDDARKVGLRFMSEIARSHDHLTPGANATIGVSIGLAVSRRCNRPSRQLIAIADAAMYDAKAAGKNRLMVVDADRLQTVSAPLADRRDVLFARNDPMTLV